jgi:hypothetical protein
MKRYAIAITIFLALGTGLTASQGSSPQLQPGSPSQVVNDFYNLLRNKQYVEGFRLSVYDGAVSTLSASELQELTPDFDSTFAKIPAGVKIKGEQITQDVATVFISMPNSQTNDPVALIRVNGQWKVGDFETYNLVRQQGRDFFFNAKMFVNEREIAELLKQMVASEFLYSQNNKGRLANLGDLVNSAVNDLPKELSQGVVRGYKIDLRISGPSFDILAVPTRYGRSGKLSFFANGAGVRAADMQGKPANVMTPLFQY